MRLCLIILLVEGAVEIVSKHVGDRARVGRKETLYARDRIIKRESYREAPNANIVASLSELTELGETDKLPEYTAAHNDQDDINEKITDIGIETDDKEGDDKDSPKPEPEVQEIQEDNSEIDIPSNNNTTLKPSIIATNDLPEAVPNDQTTTEAPKSVPTSFTHGVDLQVSKWTDFQADINSILPSRVFNPMVQTHHPAPAYSYRAPQYKIYQYAKPRYPSLNSLYQRSVKTPDYGFTRHTGPVYSKAVNAGRFGSFGRFFENQNLEGNEQNIRYSTGRRSFEVDPVIRRMMRRLNVYQTQTYPGRSHRRGRYY